MNRTNRLFGIVSLLLFAAAASSCGDSPSAGSALGPGAEDEAALARCLEGGGLSSQEYGELPLQVQTSFCQGVATKDVIGCYVYASLLVGGFPNFDDEAEADYKASVCDPEFRNEMRKADRRAEALGLLDTRGRIFDLWDKGGADTEDKSNYVLEKVNQLLAETPRPRE